MKRAYRIGVMVALTTLAIGTACIARELHRLNNVIDYIRSEIPMSLLGH